MSATGRRSPTTPRGRRRPTGRPRSRETPTSRRSAQGRQPSQTFEMRIVPASLAVAQRLHIEEGEATAVRRIMRYVNDEPWSLQDSSYPMDIAQECGLLVPHDITRGTIRVMAEHGHVETGHLDEITTRMPTPEEARTLDLGTGVPVLMYIRTAYTKDRPVRLTETIFAGDRNRVVYELGQLDALHEGDDDAHHPSQSR
ncbi:MAG: GntR family transcriptional regulator [Egibacteraceae bacterium]